MKNFYLSGLVISLMFFPLKSIGQTISYSYDNVGNRIEKVIILGGGSKGSVSEKSDEKDNKEPVKPDTLQKQVIKDDTFVNQSIKIYPNPTKGIIRLEIPDNPENSEEIRIIVHDLNGRMILNKPNEALGTEIDLSSQPDGIYILKLKKGMKVSQWKIVKQ